ncbi:MAG: NADH-quinone oxidoreductase subunit C [Pseudomonadota bacterium]
MVEAENISTENMAMTIENFKKNGYRFVTITCVKIEDGRAELLYHFDRELRLVHLRLWADAAIPLPSISPIFAAAYLVENEIQDHFGLCFAGLTPDYKRTLYLEDQNMEPPFRRNLKEKKEG